MTTQNQIFMGSDGLLQASEITDVESGDTINTAVIEASIFDADVRNPCSILAFNSGGALAIEADDIIEGATGGATATVVKVTVTSGSWLAGTAAGVLELTGQDGAFQAENIDVTATQANIGTIIGDSTTLECILMGNGQVKIPMDTTGLDAMGFIYIESSKKYNGQFDIDKIDDDGATQEVQTSLLDAVMTGGTYTLTYKGQTTAAIAWNATAANIETALELLSTVEVGDISVEVAHEPDTTVDCDWTFAAHLGDCPMLSMDITATTGATLITWTETSKGGTRGYVTITATMVSEIFTGEEKIYIGILQGKDISLTHVGGDADGYYDGIQLSTLEGVIEGVVYNLIETITYGGHTVRHRYQWAANYYENEKTD